MSKKSERNYIVFGQEHYNTLGIIRSLGEQKIKPILIVVKGVYKIASKSKYVQRKIIVDTIEDGYQELLKFKGAKNKALIYTSDDTITSLLDTRYYELKDDFLFFNAGRAGRVTYFMDKDHVNQLAIRHGLNVLPTFVVKKGEIPEGIVYPVITKAINSLASGWKGDVFVCHSDEELNNAYQHISSETVLLQKYIQKVNELCLDGFTYNEGKKTYISIASKYNYILSDTYSSYMTIENFQDSVLLEKIQNMFSEVGFEGIFSMEFLIDKFGDLYFLEINFRNSTWSYASTKAKMNLPHLWGEKMIQGGALPEIVPIQKNFTAMVEFDDYRSRVKSKMISKRKWFKDFRHTNCLFYFNRRDLKPFISLIFQKIRRKRSKGE